MRALACTAALLWVLWPFLLPGDLLARDMVVTSSMTLTPSAVGFSDLPARAVPQDGVLGLAGWGAPLLARAFIAAAALLGARAAYSLSGVPGVWVLALSPFVVERLLQGHWSLVVAVLVLPALVAWRWPYLALWLAALTPTGAVVATLVGVLAAPSRRDRAMFLGAAVLFSAPWLLPSLWSQTAASVEGLAAFAPRGSSTANMVLQVVGLGGIWNAAADLPAREGFSLAVWASALVTIVCVVRAPHRWQVLALAGLGGAIIIGLWPTQVGTLLAHVPGSGLVRDGQKLVMLAVPALVLGASRRLTGLLVMVACVVGIWGAPMALKEITPTGGPRLEYLSEQVGDKRLLIVPGSTTVEWQGRTIVDPRTKAMDVLGPGSLVVDGVVVDPPLPQYVAAEKAYAAGDFTTLAQLGVGVVLDQATGQLVPVPGASPSRPHPAGVALLSVYVCALFVVVGVPMLRRWRPRTGWRLSPERPAPTAGV